MKVNKVVYSLNLNRICQSFNLESVKIDDATVTGTLETEEKICYHQQGKADWMKVPSRSSQ